MENAKNRLHKKIILRLSKCKKVLLMSNNNTKEKGILPPLQQGLLVPLKIIPS